jgi:endonuclease/exonuclease/phosphatase family metal-dependent hydrolase
MYRLSPTPYDLVHGDALGLVLFSREPLHLATVRPHRFFAEAHEWCLTLTRSPFDIVERWFNHTFVNKGMMTVACGEGSLRLLLVTAHFTTGVTNGERLEQAQEFHRIVMEEAQTHGCHVIISGLDTNAHGSQPEMKWLTDPNQGGFMDGMTALHGDAADDHVTWEGQNELTKGNLLEPDQRLDYLLCKALKRGVSMKWEDARNVFNQPYVSDHIGVYGTFSCSPAQS